jgi:hypothetical protein
LSQETNAIDSTPKDINEGKVFTAFLDVLGFKELVLNNTHSDLNEIFSSAISGTIDAIEKISFETFDKFNMKESQSFLMVSDSIIIWTNDLSEKSFLGITLATSQLAALCMNRGIPLRGGISTGDISVARSGSSMNVFGNSIVNAYELENKQEWSGVIVDDACIDLEHIKKSEELKTLLENRVIVNYEVPMKSGKIRPYYVANWTHMFHERNYPSDVIETSFGSHNKGTDNWGVKTKMNNTIAFYNKEGEYFKKRSETELNQG